MKILCDIINTNNFSAQQILNSLELEVTKEKLSFSFEREDACIAVNRIVDHYVNLYMNYLNKNYNNNLPKSFYSNILTPYLTYIISVSYSHFLYCKKFFLTEVENHKNIIFEIKEERIFDTSDQFFENISNNIFLRKWIVSAIVEYFYNNNSHTLYKKKSIKMQWINQDFNSKKDHKYYNLFKKFKLMILYHISKKLIFKNIYGFTIYENIFISTILYVKSLFFKNIFSHQNNKNIRKKGYANNLDDIDPDFLTIIEKIIQKTIPKSLLENFQDNLAAGKKKSSGFLKTNILFDSGAIFFSDSIIYYAIRKLNNHTICFAQHGAAYATMRSYIAEAAEFFSNKFIFWGKEYPKNYTDCKFLNAPSPMLARLKDTHKLQNNNLIFVGTYINTLWDGILHPNASYIGNYIKSKYIFFSKIKADIFSCSLYKLYPSQDNNLFNEKKFVTELFPSLTLINEKCNLDKYLIQSKIIVIDHWEATTFYKALAANCPVICYKGFPPFNFYPKAGYIYTKLKEENIIFEDANSAVNFINNNWDNIASWWNSKDVQSVRKEFCELYCPLVRNYFSKWIKLLLKL